MAIEIEQAEIRHEFLLVLQAKQGGPITIKESLQPIKQQSNLDFVTFFHNSYSAPALPQQRRVSGAVL